MTTGEAIRARRVALGLTQNALAMRLGTDCVAVSRWELGKRTPQVSYLRRLADALECSVDDLVPEEAA